VTSEGLTTTLFPTTVMRLFSLIRVQAATSASRFVGHVFFHYVPPALSSSVRHVFVTEIFHSIRPVLPPLMTPLSCHTSGHQRPRDRNPCFRLSLPTPAASARLHLGTLHFAFVRSSTAPDGNIHT
jgi:hypothetical protein